MSIQSGVCTAELTVQAVSSQWLSQSLTSLRLDAPGLEWNGGAELQTRCTEWPVACAVPSGPHAEGRPARRKRPLPCRPSVHRDPAHANSRRARNYESNCQLTASTVSSAVPLPTADHELRTAKDYIPTRISSRVIGSFTSPRSSGLANSVCTMLMLPRVKKWAEAVM